MGFAEMLTTVGRRDHLIGLNVLHYADRCCIKLNNPGQSLEISSPEPTCRLPRYDM